MSPTLPRLAGPTQPLRHCARVPVATLALSLVAALVLAACGDPPPAADPVRAVRTLVVSEVSGATTRDFAGEIHARVESRLAFRVGGKITARQVDLGQRVKAEQALLRVDPSDLRLGADAARAGLHAAEVNYEQTAADYRRYEELRAQGFISSAELERRNSALAAARAQRDQARAQAGVQSNQAAYAVLQADAPGVITGLYADVGAVVGAGTPVLALAHDGPRDVVFAVPEDQLAAIRRLAGVRGGVTVSLWGGATSLPATVREVAAAADPATRTFQVKADVPAGSVELGQTATVHAELAPADGLLRLPLAAVMGRISSDGASRSVVWVVDPKSMTVREQPVQVVRAQADDLVVSGGLRPGDRVVTAGAHVLTNGQKVALYQEPALR